jgi:hypothetical protein
MFGTRSANIFSNAIATVDPSFVFVRHGKSEPRKHVDAGEYVGVAIVIERQVSHVGQIGLKQIVNLLWQTFCVEENSLRSVCATCKYHAFPTIP